MRSGYFLTLVFFVAMPALAMQPREFELVDRAVADLDPLAQSLRQVSTGLHVHGERTGFFKPISIGGATHREPVYYRLGPGFTACLHRPDYVVRRGQDKLRRNVAPEVDGEFLELIPPDTVFELRPIRQLAPPPVRSDTPARWVVSNRFWQSGLFNNLIDTRINLRIIKPIDTRIDTSVDPRGLR